MPRASLTDIQKRIARLQAQARKLEAAEADRRKAAVGDVLAMMKKLGVTLEDLGGATPARKRRAPAAAKAKATRAPVPVKYRNAETGDAWTGRGRTPRWLAALEAEGRQRAEFEVG
jgi:DNA-binding protein H-NS